MFKYITIVLLNRFNTTFMNIFLNFQNTFHDSNIRNILHLNICLLHSSKHKSQTFCIRDYNIILWLDARAKISAVNEEFTYTRIISSIKKKNNVCSNIVIN